MARVKAGPIHRAHGYPKGNVLQSWDGKPIGRIVKKSCSRVRPHERGAWISNERCSYVVEIDGRRYVGRGRGDGIVVNLRQSRQLGNDGVRRPVPAGTRREPPPVYHPRQGPPPGVPTLHGARRRRRK